MDHRSQRERIKWGSGTDVKDGRQSQVGAVLMLGCLLACLVSMKGGRKEGSQVWFSRGEGLGRGRLEGWVVRGDGVGDSSDVLATRTNGDSGIEGGPARCFLAQLNFGVLKLPIFCFPCGSCPRASVCYGNLQGRSRCDFASPQRISLSPSLRLLQKSA
jgi:hypothetical protein